MFEIKSYSAEGRRRKIPLLNENWWTGEIGDTTFSNQPFDYRDFINYIKRTPEAIGIVNALITDVLSNGAIWKGSKNKIKKAKKFCRQTKFFTKALKSGLLDWFILGNSLFWLGLDESKMKKIINEILEKECPNQSLEFKGRVTRDILDNQKTLNFKPVPWSTVTIINNSTEITEYKQVVRTGADHRRWKKEEVIHAKLMDFDGKIYGYSPMISAANVLSTLVLIKDYHGYMFDNGGEPDLMFIFPEEMADNPQIETLKRMLQEKKNAKNKHGHMIITGDCKVERVNQNDKDMEYRLLAIYYTGILAFAFNMPLSRIQSIIGSEVKSSGGSDLSDAGYWRSISHMQNYWEEILNERIFEPFFDVTFKFKRSYKQDEVREAQAKLLNTQVLQNMQNGLKLKISKNYVKEVLDLDDDDVDWEHFEKLDPMEIDFNGQQPQAPNKDIFKTEAQNRNDETKRNSAMKNVNSP